MEAYYLLCICQIVVLVASSLIESPWKEYVFLVNVVFWLVLVIGWSLDSSYEKELIMRWNNLLFDINPATLTVQEIEMLYSLIHVSGVPPAEAEEQLRQLISTHVPAQSNSGTSSEKTDCRFYANSSHLLCAVNPKGPCEGCRHYEPQDTQS